MHRRREAAAKAFLAALWIVCVYRAATQSFVHDEALTYQLFISHPFADMFRVFSANHHFLNTLLMYGCASLFGLSEWSLRIPALAGAALYFAAVYRIARHAFGAGLTFLLAVALLTLHPLILDFLVAARGYGMGLALWLWAFALLLPCFEQPETAAPRGAGIALSLSVVASLVLLIPAAVLAAIALWRLPRKLAFAAPIAAVALLFVIVSPLHAARPDNFYAGSATIADSLRRLAWATVEHRRAWRDTPIADAARDALAFFLGPAILIAGLVTRRSLLVTLSASIAIASALVLWLLHIAFRVP